MTAFKAWHDALSPSPFPIVYDNLPGVKGSKTPWARVSVQHGHNWQPFVGQNGRKRCAGFLSVQIFAPEDAGPKVATEYAQRMADFWDNKELSATAGGVTTTVLFRNTSLLLISAKDGYQQHNAAAEFQRDTIST